MEGKYRIIHLFFLFVCIASHFLSRDFVWAFSSLEDLREVIKQTDFRFHVLIPCRSLARGGVSRACFDLILREDLQGNWSGSSIVKIRRGCGTRMIKRRYMKMGIIRPRCQLKPRVQEQKDTTKVPHLPPPFVPQPIKFLCVDCSECYR